MRFYVDFEATQPEQEIISIGIVAEDGSTFSSLMKPKHSKITKFITDLTGITQEMMDEAPSADQVFSALYYWLSDKEKNFHNWDFYSFGDGDQTFLKCTADSLESNGAVLTAGVILLTLKDYSKVARSFFKGRTSLINAFNYVKSQETTQIHDALEDAKMLQIVAEYIEHSEPLKTNPFVPGMPANVKMPSGTFTCRHTKNGKYCEFVSCDDAIDWLITNVIRPANPSAIHRERIMKNIMKAVRTGKCYAEFKWTRSKEVNNA
jgi:inhibitor of KinA sporulation pathway (predicted exonuclease)